MLLTSLGLPTKEPRVVTQSERDTITWLKYLVGAIVAGMMAVSSVLYAQDRELNSRVSQCEMRLAALEAKQTEQFRRLLSGVEKIEAKIDRLQGITPLPTSP